MEIKRSEIRKINDLYQDFREYFSQNGWTSTSFHIGIQGKTKDSKKSTRKLRKFVLAKIEQWQK